MKFLELDNTLAGVNKLKNDLNKFLQIFNVISMILFSFYYVYLILKNLNNVLYLVVYSILFVVLISTFFIEVFINENKKDDRKSKRLTLENKRKLKRLLKVPKYLAKAVIVGIAIYQTFSNYELDISNLFNIALLVLLIIQICFDLIVYYSTFYVDFLTRCVEKDIEQSKLIKFVSAFNVKKNIGEKLENLSYKITNEEKFTEQEKEIYDLIEENTKQFKEEKELETDNSIKRSLDKIVSTGKDKIKNFLSKK